MSNQSSKTKKVGGHAISSIYYRSILDPIIEIARAVSHDFLKRPPRYRTIPQEVVGLLESFRLLTGSAPEWMSAAQRAAVCCGIFGGAFSAAACTMRTAAVSVVEQAGSENRSLLLQTFRDSVEAFYGYLSTVEGSAVELADGQMRALFDNAVAVLRDETIAGAFGFASPPQDLASAEGAYLIQEIQRGLRLRYPAPALSQHRVMLLQRVAKHGEETIDGVLKQKPGTAKEDRTNTLIGSAYSWEKALQGLLFTIDTLQAWKDPTYRESLSSGERAMLPPHPAGEISLTNTQLDPAVAKRALGGLGFSTFTLVGICCSTGDLPCTQSSEGSDYCCPTNVGFTCPVSDCGVCGPI